MVEEFDVKDEIEGFVTAYSRSLGRLRECLAGCTADQLNWRPAIAEANSLAVLANHVMGNVRQNVLGVACGLPDDRDRDAEFVSRADAPEPLIERARDLEREIEEALPQLGVEALPSERQHPSRGGTTAHQALLIAARHAMEHVGQMELTRDLARAALPAPGDPPTLLRLHHAALTVPTERLDEARSFYSGVLGLQEAPRPEAELGRPGIWYRLGNTELHIQCRDGAPPDGSDRHPALVVDDVAALKTHLISKGVEITDAPTLVGRERFFCRDPFGNRLEFMTAP